MSDTESYTEYQERLQQELAGQTKQEVLREQGGVDLDNFPKQHHRWIDRGLVLSCEGAGHANHRVFKRR